MAGMVCRTLLIRHLRHVIRRPSFDRQHHVGATPLRRCGRAGKYGVIGKLETPIGIDAGEPVLGENLFGRADGDETTGE